MAFQISEDEYTSVGHAVNAIVNLGIWTYRCRVFDVDKIPCTKVMRSLKMRFEDNFYHYSCHYYNAYQYDKAYEENIYIIPHKGQCEDSYRAERHKNSSIRIHTQKCRKAMKHRKLAVEGGGSSTKRMNKGSKCKKYGHKRTPAKRICQLSDIIYIILQSSLWCKIVA